VDGVSAKAKRRWLLRWWTAQALVVYCGLPLLLLGEKNPPSPGDYAKGLLDEDYFVWVGGAIVAISALQWIYLRPVRPPQVGRRPVRLVWSMLIGGLGVALLITCLFLAFWGVRRDLLGVRSGLDDYVAGVALCVFALNWITATPLLLAFGGRGASHEDVLTRAATNVFAGTVVDVLATLPLDAVARRREDCICARGTFWAVLLGLSVGAVFCGPAVFLVLLRRRRRRWPGGLCVACGADVGEDLRVPRCPACGAGWAD
jgi:hypothetical protein